MIPSERLATDVGKHFGQTLIELTRKILARRHTSSIQVDISRFLTTKERNDRISRSASSAQSRHSADIPKTDGDPTSNKQRRNFESIQV